MKALPLAMVTCLLAGLAAPVQPQEPQTQPLRVRPRPYATAEVPAAEPVPAGKGRTLFNEFEIRQAPLVGALVLGSYELSNPSIDIVDLFPFVNLGHKFLERFVVTLDVKNRRIRFEPAPAADKASSR